jgi:hypothetical protein
MQNFLRPDQRLRRVTKIDEPELNPGSEMYDLHGMPISLGERRTQDLMASDDRVDAVPQRIHVQRTANARRIRQVVSERASLGAAAHPRLFLRKRQRKRPSSDCPH